MPAAWSNTHDYIQGDVVTHGGHTYEWGSANPSRGIEPPTGDWTQLDAPAPAAQGGASVATDSTSYSASATLPADNSGLAAVDGFTLNDTASPHCNLSATDTITLVDAGIYAVTLTAHVNVPTGATAGATCSMTPAPVGPGVGIGPGIDHPVSASLSYYFNAGDTIQVQAWSTGLNAALGAYIEIEIAKVA